MLINKNKLTITVLLLTLVLLFTSCVEEEVEEEIVAIKPDIPVFINLLPIPEGPEQSALYIDTGLSEKAKEKYELNGDTIGWLQVPNTSIDDVILFYPNKEDKYFYLRKNFEKRYSWDGSYFVDYRSSMSGGREGLSKNTVIYGHSMSDDPTTPLFSQLKKYWDKDYARENPYIYFSDLQEDMAWEIFAVFITDKSFHYNIPDLDDDAFAELLTKSQELSMYDYNTDVDQNDKILTLSTCLYTIGGVNYGYPNNYRYVVMAKLIPVGQRISKTASITVNTAAVVSK